MASMRHLTAAAVLLSAVAFAVPAFAAREPGALKQSASSGFAAIVLVLVVAVVVGVAMMNPRRTHQD